MVFPNLNRLKLLSSIAANSFSSDLNKNTILKMSEHSHSMSSNLLFTTTNKSTMMISFVGAFVLSGAVLLAALNTLIVIYNSLTSSKISMFLELNYSGKKHKKSEATIGLVRQQLGEITALGLEMLVVADIMESLTQHVESFSWNSLGKMAAIAVFRTGLAYALGKEVKEIEEKNGEHEKVETKTRTI